MRPGVAIFGLWVGWGASWAIASLWTNRTEKSVGMRAELGHRAITALGALLFVVPAHGYEGVLRLWHPGWTLAWICVAFTAMGFAFCWWARLHLGRLWSGNITRKADHHVVDTGPYALVRHPIYSGIYLALVATMIAKGTILGLAGGALIGFGLYLKARIEERWLHDELGAAAYDEYRRRVPMLIPMPWR